MLRRKVKDRLSRRTETLSLLKSTTLDVIIKTFVRELLNDVVRKTIIKDFAMIEQSLRELCTMTKNANRSKKEFRKLMKKENKSRELKLYKEMIQRIMSRKKIEFMLINFRAESFFDN
jgi:hypothetical protein